MTRYEELTKKRDLVFTACKNCYRNKKLGMQIIWWHHYYALQKQMGELTIEQAERLV